MAYVAHLQWMVFQGAWVAQLVKRPTVAQVMISWFRGVSPVSGSVLTAQSLEPAVILSFSLSLCSSPAHVLSLSVSQKINNIKKQTMGGVPPPAWAQRLFAVVPQSHTPEGPVPSICVPSLRGPAVNVRCHSHLARTHLPPLRPHKSPKAPSSSLHSFPSGRTKLNPSVRRGHLLGFRCSSHCRYTAPNPRAHLSGEANSTFLQAPNTLPGDFSSCLAQGCAWPRVRARSTQKLMSREQLQPVMNST